MACAPWDLAVNLKFRFSSAQTKPIISVISCWPPELLQKGINLSHCQTQLNSSGSLSQPSLLYNHLYTSSVMTVTVSCLLWSKAMFSKIFLNSWISISSPWCLYSLWRDGSTYSKVRPVLGQCPWLSVHASAVLPFLHLPQLCSLSFFTPSALFPDSYPNIKSRRAQVGFFTPAFHHNVLLGVRFYSIISEMPPFPSELPPSISPWTVMEADTFPSSFCCIHFNVCCFEQLNSDWVAVAFVILGSRPLEIILLWVQGGRGQLLRTEYSIITFSKARNFLPEAILVPYTCPKLLIQTLWKNWVPQGILYMPYYMVCTIRQSWFGDAFIFVLKGFLERHQCFPQGLASVPSVYSLVVFFFLLFAMCGVFC